VLIGGSSRRSLWMRHPANARNVGLGTTFNLARVSTLPRRKRRDGLATFRRDILSEPRLDQSANARFFLHHGAATMACIPRRRGRGDGAIER
jgi:hypothetical protein